MSRDFAKISAQIYLLRPEEGGRKTPIFTGYRPTVYFGDRQTDGLITFDCREGARIVVRGKVLEVQYI